MRYAITIQLQSRTGITIADNWKMVNEILNRAFQLYGDIMLGYKIESFNA